MSDDPSAELPDRLRQELAGLDSEPGQSHTRGPLEDAIVSRLQEQGLLRGPASVAPARRRSPLLLAAAAVVLLTVGVSLGRASVATASPAPAPTHILLLHGLARVGAQVADDSTTRAIYSAWARSEGANGVVVGGEELGNGGTELAANASAPGLTEAQASTGEAEVVGYFLIRAASDEEALRTARRCPHLAYGGTVEVRAIVRD